MFPRRDPNLLSQYLCRFCGERIAWGVILRVLRVDPDALGYQLNESYCDTACLAHGSMPRLFRGRRSFCRISRAVLIFLQGCARARALSPVSEEQPPMIASRPGVFAPFPKKCHPVRGAISGGIPPLLPRSVGDRV